MEEISFASEYNRLLKGLKDNEINDHKLKNIPDSTLDLNCACKCRSFIKDWQDVYNKGGKEISTFVEKLKDLRLYHTISCFLLGISLYDRSKFIKDSIDRCLEKIKDSGDDNAPSNTFLFAWMLTCIYHDFGYAYEEGNKKFVEKDYPVGQAFNCGDDFIPKANQKSMKDYGQFCKCRLGHLDHGIYGGRKLLLDLSQNNSHYDRFKGYYHLAAQTIMCHNMFYCKEDDNNLPCYKGKNMSELIRGKNEHKREFKNHPMLYLLSLVDNIEPTKRFKNVDILNDMYLSISDDEKLIVKTPQMTDELCKQYIDSLDEMNTWLTDVRFRKGKYSIVSEISL